MLPMLQPPPTAEELALKEQVTQMLTSQGVLAKLRAELRAAVFEVMHEREGFEKANDAPKLSDFPVETRTTALSLIAECMRFFHWEHALRVLLAETNAEIEQTDSALLAKKLGLTGLESPNKPTLFQLVESRVESVVQSTVPARTVVSTEQMSFDEDELRRHTRVCEPEAKCFGSDEEAVHQSTLPVKEIESTAPVIKMNEVKTEDAESSAEIEESMAEEVSSGSELEESNFTNYEDEGSQGQSAECPKQPTTLTSRQLQEEAEDDVKALEDSHGKDKSNWDDQNAISLGAPPPAPAKLPALPPLVGAPNVAVDGDAEDDFDAEEEAERLRKLDAALQAMEAEDDTGTLQQLKASLQMELQEQDSFVSSGGLGKSEEGVDEDEAKTSMGKKEEDDDGYGSSDFEEEEEIASEISEEMESMPDLSDKEDESEDEAAVPAAAEPEPLCVLLNDTRVDSEDALNSYDYIEDVEKGEW